MNLANALGGSPLWIASQEGQVRAIATLAELRASIDQAALNGCFPIAKAAIHGHNEVIRLLAHLGARLRGSGVGFWMHYSDKRQDTGIWTSIVQAGGDEGTDESLRKRIRMLEEAKMWDPR